MPTQTTMGNISLLRAYLVSMAGVAMLFSLIALGIWVYTTDVVKLEGQLISQLLPELDAAYQLTAATAGLQSQGLLLSSSKNIHELEERRLRLNTTIADTTSTIDALPMLELDVRAGLKMAVQDISTTALKLAGIKQNQLVRQQQIKLEKQRLLDKLANIKRDVQKQITRLTGQLLEISTTKADSDAGESSEPEAAQAFADRVFEYDAVNIAIQDYLLLNQDLVSLAAIIVRVPLLNSDQSVNTARQNRDLLLSALVNRSIYINVEDRATSLLAPLSSLRNSLRGEKNLFSLQSIVLSHEAGQHALATQMREHTLATLEETDRLRYDSRSAVSELASQTLKGLQRYRSFIVVLCFLLVALLAGFSYWLLYRKTVLPLVEITRRFDDVGSDRFSAVSQNYYLRELATLSSAMSQLDAAHKNMHAKDAQLQSINRDLQRANEDLGQFAHIASHDLQEPLRKLQQFSELMEEDYATLLDDEGKYFLKTIRTSAQRMSILIKETLAYSHAGSAHQSLESVDLGALLHQLLDEMDMAVHEAQGEFTIGDLPVVLANPLGMAQLFRNLMLNALKYRQPDKPARISIEAVNGLCGAASDPTSAGTLCIRIQDNGVGIAGKYLQRIFMPFERLQNEGVPGTGLGLAICNKVCESHGWELVVSSKPGTGTLFEIRIPASRQALG